MNTQAPTLPSDLESAQTALRDVLAEDFRNSARIEAGSLDRILVHVSNIQKAIAESPECLPNAAKRLGDFADITSRMLPKHPESSAKLANASQALRTASLRLRESIQAATSTTASA